MSSKSRIVVLIAAVLVVVMGALGVTVLPARASADQNSEWIPTHATEEQLKGVLCHADDFAGRDNFGDSIYVRYYFRAEDNPGEAPTLTLDDGRVLAGQYDYDNVIYLGRTKCSKVVFKGYAKPSSIDFTYREEEKANTIDENKWLTAIEDIDKLDTSEITNMNSVFEWCTALEYIDLSHFDTSRVTTMQRMFYNCSSLKGNVDISRLDMSACKNISSMFASCSSIESADISNPSTSSLESLYYMFCGCSALRSVNLDDLNTSSVRDMSHMFRACRSLESVDLSTLDTSKATDMSYLFYGCNKLKTIGLDGLDTSAVTNMQEMFGDCVCLESLDVSRFNTSSVTDMSYMFCNCRILPQLDVSGFDTANVINMSNMFSGCQKITSLEVSRFNTSKAQFMHWMFASCNMLQDIDVSHFDTSNVSRLDFMFSGCHSLQYVDVSNFNLNNVKNMGSMFVHCSVLKSIDMSHSEATDVSAPEMFNDCPALESVQLFHGTCKNMLNMFRQCKALKSIDISMISRSNADSFNCKKLFLESGVEQLRTRGDLFSADSNCSQALDKTQLKKITIVANSGNLAVPDFNSLATTTVSGRSADLSQTFGSGSEAAVKKTSLKNGGTLAAGGAEDTSWYLQALAHKVEFYDSDSDGSSPIAIYEVVDGEPFNEKAPSSDSLPPFVRLNGWFSYTDESRSSKIWLDDVIASGELGHVTKDWHFYPNYEWKDEDSEYHSTSSYVVRVPSKISYEHQKTGTVDVSTAYDVSVSAFPINDHKLGNIKFLELTTSLSGFDGLNASVSDSSNSDISSRLVDIEEFTKTSDDNTFVAGKQLKDVLHLSGSVDSAKAITGHITYSCKPYATDPTPEPEPGSGEGGGTAK